MLDFLTQRDARGRAAQQRLSECNASPFSKDPRAAKSEERKSGREAKTEGRGHRGADCDTLIEERKGTGKGSASARARE